MQQSFDSALLGVQRPSRRCKGRRLGVLTTPPLNKFEGVLSLLSFIYSGTVHFLQIRKPVCTVYFCLPSRFIWCPSSIGQQEVSWPSYSPPRYDCTCEGNNSKLVYCIVTCTYMCVTGTGTCAHTHTPATRTQSTHTPENLAASRDLTLGLGSLHKPCWN